MTAIVDNGFARITKETLIRNPSTPWAVTWNDIAYNSTTTINEKLLNIIWDLNVILNWANYLTTNDKAYVRIPSEYDWMDLSAVVWVVGTWSSWKSTSWNVTFWITNLTTSQSMTSTNLSIDFNDYTSSTSSSPVVINTSYDNVNTNDIIEISCITSWASVTFATVTLSFIRP